MYPDNSILLSLLVLVFATLASSSWADSIPAEEIEVPPPTWSVFYEEEPLAVLPPVESPHDWDSMEPILLTETATPPAAAPTKTAQRIPPGVVVGGGGGLFVLRCVLPWFCSNNDDDNPFSVPPVPPEVPVPPGPPILIPPVPPEFPTHPVPEPGAFLIFGAGLLSLVRLR